MNPISYINRLKKDTTRWLELGLLGKDQVTALLRDVESRRSTRSFGTVVAILGAVLIAAALVAFVAANWDEMSKLARVGLLAVAIWAAYLTAYVMAARQNPALAQAFLVVGIGAFGASIMLIGQIYQLQGRNEDALLAWMAGSVVTTIAARSSWSLVFSAGLSLAWMIAEFGSGGFGIVSGGAPFWSFGFDPFYLYPLLALGLAGLAVWLGSRLAGHILMVGLLVWSVLFIDIFNGNFSPRAIAIMATVLILLSLTLRDVTNHRRLGDFGVSVIGYLVVSLFVYVLFDLWFSGGISGQPKPQIEPGASLLWVTLMSLISQNLGLSIAVVTGFAIAFDMARRGQTLLRDQWVIAIAGLVLLAVRLPVIQMLDVKFLLDTVVTFALSIWTIRFGWRLESRFVSAIGFLGFAAILLITYQLLFGSLLNTAAFYAIAGIGLLVLAAYLLRRDRRSGDGGAS